MTWTKPTRAGLIIAKADALVGSHPSVASSRKRKPKPGASGSGGKGAVFRVDEEKLRKFASPEWKAVTRILKREFELDEEQLAAAFRETERRLLGIRATEDQVVGTFIEVVAGVSGATVGIRRSMVRVSLVLNIWALIVGERNLFSTRNLRTGGFDNAAATDGFKLRLADLPLSPDELKAATDAFPVRTPGMSADRWHRLVDKEAERLARVLESKVVYGRDTVIGTQEFVDRLAFLPIGEDRLLLLMSEEYKAPRSGGGGAQSSLRINRLFNGEVGPDTLFSYFPVSNAPLGSGRAVDPEPVVITMSKVIVSSSTRGGDQLLVKASASGKDDVLIAMQKRSTGLARDKRRYGEQMRVGKAVDLTFVKQYFSFPGREVRRVIRHFRKNR